MIGHSAVLAGLDRVVDDSLRFKQRLRIGEDGYALRRLTKQAWQWWDTASAASTGVTAAKSALVASTFFAPAAETGLLGWLGLTAPAAAVTPVGWVVAAALLAGGGYYGVTRWWSGRPDTAVDVIPRFINTPLDQLGLAVFDCAAGLALMVARADGAVTPDERDELRTHLIKDWGFDSAFVDASLPSLEREADDAAVEAAARAMARFVRANPDCNADAMQGELLAFLRELAQADGRVDPAELAAIARIEAVFAAEAGWSLAKLRADAQGALATAGEAGAQAATTTREALTSAGNTAAGLLSVAGARATDATTAARDAVGGLIRRR